MHILFLETRRLSENSFDPIRCEKGKVYDLAHSAACHALNQGWAREATAEEIEAQAESEPQEAEAALPVLDAMKSFRPQPTRGTGPTNPATLKVKGEDV